MTESQTTPLAPAPTSPATPAFQPAPAASPGNVLSILSLVGGIAGIVFAHTVIIPVAAIVLGFLARTREPGSRTMATWGIILGFVALFGWLIIVALGFAAFVPFVLFGAFT